MKLRLRIRLVSFVFIGVFSAVVANAQTGSTPVRITPEEIDAHLRFLSSDLLEGRAPATRGGRLTEEYIASQLKTFGVRPGVGDTSYFQRVPIDVVWTHPIVGGSPFISAPFLAVLGSVAWSIGAVSAAVSLKRSGSSWGPVVLLALSSFGIAIFKTHAWPGGPLMFGGMAIAAAWLQLERAGQKHERTDGAA